MRLDRMSLAQMPEERASTQPLDEKQMVISL
jgi:hypothetical protein